MMGYAKTVCLVPQVHEEFQGRGVLVQEQWGRVIWNHDLLKSLGNAYYFYVAVFLEVGVRSVAWPVAQ